VDTDFFAPADAAQPATASGKLRIVFIGNDLERKGGRLLLELMREGLAEIAELHIVSGAEIPAELPLGVTWHRGLKPRTPELLEQLQLADVFALPTYEDCFPQALIEAMSCGLPLISSRVMGIPELVQDGVNGFCLEPKDKVALAKALRTLAESPELRRQFATRSREMACERFSFTNSRRTWEGIFTQAAQAHLPHAKV
jgi:glycosyltransferase involved in cell wall biosynthesis